MWLRSVGAMVGAILGVGVFGIPYAAAQSGLVIGLLYLVVIGFLLTMLQLIYAEIAVHSPGYARLVGLVTIHKGRGWRYFTTFVSMGSMIGAMTAFIIIGGNFFHRLLSPMFGGGVEVYQIALGLVDGLFLLGSRRAIQKFAPLVVLFLFAVYAVIIVSGMPYVQLEHLTAFHPENALVPYGPVLFAMAGFAIVPEMHYILTHKYEKMLPSAILTGMGLVMVLYAAFATVVVGVTGDATTQDAISGLATVIPEVAFLGTLVGAISVASIFLMVGFQMKNVLTVDFHLPPLTAWLATLIGPLTLYLLGVREFIQVIGFTGAVFSGSVVIIIVLVFERMRVTVCKTTKCFQPPLVISLGIIAVILIGMITKIAETIGLL